MLQFDGLINRLLHHRQHRGIKEKFSQQAAALSAITTGLRRGIGVYCFHFVWG